MTAMRRACYAAAGFGVWAQVACASPCATVVEVSQETTPGAADWDSHFVSLIDAFETTLTTAGYYNWDATLSSFNPPMGEDAPTLDEDTAHLFLVQASDGLSVYQVYDTTAGSSTSNTADTTWSLAGDTAGFIVEDGPQSAQDQYTSTGTLLTTHHAWGNSKTDGYAIGTLDGSWTMVTEFDAQTNLTDWLAIGADGGRHALDLTLDRRVRVREYTCLADVDLDHDVDLTDLTTFTTMYLAGDPCADIDGDGSVTLGDLTAYTTLYLAGC